MWLLEASKLRLLFDPLLHDTYHDGVFAVVPRRTIDVDALKPDVIVVTHRHPDHFDVASLDQLAQRHPNAVVLTADVLVGQVCQRLGFAHVSLLEEWQPIALDGLTLLTTPSFCAVEEWGVMVATKDGVVWNQVDTELADRSRAVIERAAELLDRPGLRQKMELVIARWQPLLQVDALLGKATNFPLRRYSRELDHIAACQAAAVIPGAAGSQLRDPNHWLNAMAYPVSAQRLRRDLKLRCPNATVHDPRPGACWAVEDGVVRAVEDSALVVLEAHQDGRVFCPMSIPPIQDVSGDRASLHGPISTWVHDVLTPKVGAYLGPRGGGCLVLEVVYACGSVDVWTLQVSRERVVLSAGQTAEPDLRNQIAASDLAAVIAGETHWGRPLLSGRMRSAGVLYTVDEDGVMPVEVPPFFLYLALSYAEATERWVWREVRRCLADREGSLSIDS